MRSKTWSSSWEKENCCGVVALLKLAQLLYGRNTITVDKAKIRLPLSSEWDLELIEDFMHSKQLLDDDTAQLWPKIKLSTLGALAQALGVELTREPPSFLSFWSRHFTDHTRSIEERKIQILMKEEEFWRYKGTGVCFLLCDACANKIRFDSTHKCIHGHYVTWKTNGSRSGLSFWDQFFPEGVRSKPVTRTQFRKKMEFIQKWSTYTVAAFAFTIKARVTPATHILR